MEEQDLDGCDVFVAMGLLILEGRVPKLKERGYGEGPHCARNLLGNPKHKCEPQSFLVSCINNTLCFNDIILSGEAH